MKKHLLFGLFACIAVNAFTQNQASVKGALVPASSSAIESLIKPSQDLVNAPKTLLCQDTIRYPQIKEQLLNVTPAFFTFTLWTIDAEYMSQTYLHTGGTITIPRIEFFGNRNPAGAASVTVEGSIYNVNGSNVPTTLISSGSMTLTSTTAGYFYVVLNTPAVVTGNYAVVIRPTSVGGQLDLYLNNSLAGQVQDEGLSRVRSSYYPQSGGNWVSVPVLTNDLLNFPAIYDFEALISPIVSYTINTAATAVTSPACLGTAVQFNNSTTPAGIINSRMYNYQRFNLHFGIASSDSTYAWNLGNLSPLVWSSTTNYTYPAAGSYNATLFTLGGFWSSCTDNAVVPIVINPIGNSSFNYTSASYCQGSANQTPAISQAGTFSATPAGLNFVNTTTGQINLGSSLPNTYIISYTTTGSCPTTSTQTVTINPAANSNFTYSGNTFCTGSSNQIPSITDAGTFTATPAGLVFVSTTTGEIDMSLSTNNTYVISYVTSGTCASTSAQNITLTNTPIGNFAYSQSSYCSNDASQLPVFGSGASGGLFSSTPAGLTISLGGQINTTSSLVGNYVVANTISGGGCPVVIETTTVSINTPPVVSMAALASVCASDAPFLLIGGMPAMGVYNGSGVNAGIFSPSVAMDGVHPITYTFTDANNCQASAMAAITVNPTPNVLLAAFNGVCINNSAFVLSGGSPAGGSFSGPGVASGGMFDPSIAGLGTHIITYSFASGGCEGTATQTISVDGCASINEIEGLSALVFPNPTNDELTIIINNGNVETLAVSLISADGKEVLTHVTNQEKINIQLNVSEFSAGVYYLSLNSNSGKIIQKVVIQ